MCVCVCECVCVYVCVRKGEERVNVGVERKMHQGHTTDVHVYFLELTLPHVSFNAYSVLTYPILYYNG